MIGLVVVAMFVALAGCGADEWQPRVDGLGSGEEWPTPTIMPALNGTLVGGRGR